MVLPHFSPFLACLPPSRAPQSAVYKVDLVLLVGYMRIVSAPFVAAWRGAVLNVHPSLLPAFAGGMDLQVHAAVIEVKRTPRPSCILPQRCIMIMNVPLAACAWGRAELGAFPPSFD